MIARLLLLIAVFAGLLGGQLGSRGLCVEKTPPSCGGCCAPSSDTSCCRSGEKPLPPVTAPAASAPLDWKMIGQPVVLLLPRSFECAKQPSHAIGAVPRANGLARIERTCVRLI